MTWNLFTETNRNLFKDDIWNKKRTDLIAKVVIAKVVPLNLNWKHQGFLQENCYSLCSCSHQIFTVVNLLMLKLCIT